MTTRKYPQGTILGWASFFLWIQTPGFIYHLGNSICAYQDSILDDWENPILVIKAEEWT